MAPPSSNETTTTASAAAAMAQKNSSTDTSKSDSTPAAPTPGSSSTTTATKKQSAAGATPTPVGTATTADQKSKNNETSDTAKIASVNKNNTTSMSYGGTNLEKTLHRLTQGLPKSELRLMVSEADECETALREEIAIMEQALLQGNAGATAASGSSSVGGGGGELEAAATTNIHTILESSFTPMDRCWTFSALVGRLRGEFTIPSLFAIRDEKHPDHVTAMKAMDKFQKQQLQLQQQKSTLDASSSNATSSTTTAVAASSVSPTPPTPPAAPVKGRPTLAAAADANNRALLTLPDNRAYHRLETSANILACWKKIFTNRAAIVFKKAVKPEEAPGYTDRIKFPMDLSLIRKMIVARHIQSYAQLHHYIGLISHNCCKYNGKESDYGMVARDFEAMADHIIRTTVCAAHAKQGDSIPQPTSTTATSTAATTTLAINTVTAPQLAEENKMPPPTSK